MHISRPAPWLRVKQIELWFLAVTGRQSRAAMQSAMNRDIHEAAARLEITYRLADCTRGWGGGVRTPAVSLAVEATYLKPLNLNDLYN